MRRFHVCRRRYTATSPKFAKSDWPKHWQCPIHTSAPMSSGWLPLIRRLSRIGTFRWVPNSGSGLSLVIHSLSIDRHLREINQSVSLSYSLLSPALSVSVSVLSVCLSVCRSVCLSLSQLSLLRTLMIMTL